MAPHRYCLYLCESLRDPYTSPPYKDCEAWDSNSIPGGLGDKGVNSSWIQVDSVHLLANPELIADMFYEAESKMAEMEELVSKEGMMKLTTVHTSASEAWGNHDYVEALKYLGGLIEMCDAPRLLSLAEETLQDMEEQGYDTEWGRRSYGYSLSGWVSGTKYWSNHDLKGIIAWHDILSNDLFTQAREDIDEAARVGGENIEALECFYEAALNRWERGSSQDYPQAKNFLDMIPEQTLLPIAILSLILLPALPRRR